MQFKLTADLVVCNNIGPHGPGHPSVRVCFPDRAFEVKLMHESTYLLMIHSDTYMKKPHIDAANTFVISAEFISLQDQLKILIITGFTRNSFLRIS